MKRKRNFVGKELEEFFKQAQKFKPKYELSAEEMDEFNERMFR